MPKLKDDTIRRKYYSIGQLAKYINARESQIRFWEEELGIKPIRAVNKRFKNRIYKDDQVEGYKKLRDLIYTNYYTLFGIKKLFLKEITKEHGIKLL